LATWVQSAEEVGAINSLADSIPAVYFADMQAASTQADVALLDSRSAIMAGTQVSNAAQVVLARKLACHWLPGALLPPIKAVALDLDNTLHAGILGEDGIHGVKLTPGHAELQYYIKSLQQRGIFITLVSRNEYSDVEALFAERGDYPLRWEDFSAVEVSWGDKPAALERIAKTLRIAHDAVLFVDDNPGELARAAMRLPQIHTLYAHPNASQTTRAVHYYPGLWRWKVEEDDSKRILDLKANAERESLAEHVTDTTDYFRSLQINLTFSYDDKSQITRLADLCHKTNQFNLAMRRFNQTEVVEHMDLEDTCVASVQLGDRLSDSGVIAVFIAERHGKELRIEELCISCRALGRQLEDNIILVALRDMPIFKGCQEVAFRVQHGPRNQPALDWLAQQMNKYEHPAPGLHTMPAQQLLDFESEACVILSKG
jgi:FkbH-like protein